MNYSEYDIKRIIGDIIDPDLEKTLDELNAVKQVVIEQDLIRIYLELVQPVQWVATRINALCNDALKIIAPNIENEIIFSEKPADTSNRNVLTGVKNIIAVASGKGGVGKSAIAANIAASLSLQGAKVGILDGDVYGPSQPTMFGVVGEAFEAFDTPDGKNYAYPVESYGIKVASMGFMLNRDEAAIIRGPMLAGYFSMLFEQLDWGELDFLVFDLPPGTGDIQLTMTQKIPLTGAVVVTTPQEISVSDVRRSIAMFKRVNVEILGVVENMSYFTPEDMPDKKYYIFGHGGGRKVAYESDVPFLGEVPLNINMRETNDNGKPLVLTDDAGMQGIILKEITANIVSKIRKHNYNLIENPLVNISI